MLMSGLENIIMKDRIFGKYCYGKTPYQTFLESKHIAIEKTIEKNSNINNNEKEIFDSLNC